MRSDGIFEERAMLNIGLHLSPPWVANHDKDNNDSEDGCGGDDDGAIL